MIAVRRSNCLKIVGFVTIALASSQARAQSTTSKASSTAERGVQSVRDADAIEMSAFGAAGVIGLAVDVVSPGPSTPNWSGPILFDDGARDALSARTDAGRDRAALASDFGIAAIVARPFVDAWVSSKVGRIDRHVGIELVITAVEAFALTEALTALSKRVIGRQRPDAQEAACDSPNGIADASACARRDRNASFWSGHTSIAFTSATLVCTEHARLAFYGEPLDTLTCASGLVAAAGIGTLRVIADRHWASDVFVGAIVGVISGWTVPTFLRFRTGKTDGLSIVPVVMPMAGGIGGGVAGFGF